jgi:hypothetical protein
MESPTTTTSDLASRRWIGRFVRVGLVLLAIVIAGSWIGNKVSHKTRDLRVVKAPVVADAALAPGDMRIYNGDSTVDIILRGDQVLAGLSPKTIEKVKSEMQRSTIKDSSGLGGIIASAVKGAVAENIGIHAAYPVWNIRNMRYENGQIIIVRMDGGESRLFGDAKVDNRNVSKTFSEEDAERFFDAVRARQRELRGGNSATRALVPARP